MAITIPSIGKRSAACGLVTVIVLLTANARAQTVDTDLQADSAALGRQLGSLDPHVRQRAAESLAQLAALDQKRVVEGYRLQEKDKKVRLALDWALYRMGKSEALYRIVGELDSSRHKQAVGYLSRLESASLLYDFLKQETNQPKVTVGLLKSLGRIGDADTLEQIKPFRQSFYPGVAEAAEEATDEIEKRLAQVENPLPTRPRTVGTGDKTSP